MTKSAKRKEHDAKKAETLKGPLSPPGLFEVSVDQHALSHRPSSFIPSVEVVRARHTTHPEWKQYEAFTKEWFFNGANATRLKEKPGVHRHAAICHAGTILRTFDLPHDTKIAAVTFLLTEWFDLVGGL